ncbi:hypothetical protein ACFXBB_13840 [Streptomyces scopuliridis]|uniref:hypothetical protein n=1 Tax=Streptomyces scopuliridis TaxID=452529 RepID=UPI0036A444B4
MTTSRQYTGERIEVDPLTASTITDNQLDAIRAELRYYRARYGAANPTTACGAPSATGQAPEDGNRPTEPSRPPC